MHEYDEGSSLREARRATATALAAGGRAASSATIYSGLRIEEETGSTLEDSGPSRGEEQVLAARDAAQRALRNEVGGLSVQLAERLLREQLADDSRRSATIDSFLGELDQQTAARSGAN